MSREESVGATVNAPMDYESSMSYFNFCIRRDLGRFSYLPTSRSSRSPSSGFWRWGHFEREWNKEAEKIKKCQHISSFSASGAKCISLNRLFGSWLLSNVVGAGFRRWYVSIEMRIFLLALHGGSSIPLFYFRPLCRQSCYHSDQCDRSPAGHALSFDLYWGSGTNSWPHCDEIVLLVFIVKFFSLRRFVRSSAQFLAHTHDIWFHSPNFSRPLTVDRII